MLINLPKTCSSTCYLFLRRCIFLLLQYSANIVRKRQFLDSPAGPSLPSAFYSSGDLPVVKSNRPDVFAFLSGSAKKAGFLLGIFVLLSFANASAATITSTRAGGNWNDPATWVGGVVPSAGDDVTITSGATVVIDSDAVVGTLTVSGILQYDSSSAYTLTATEFITVNAEGIFRSAQAGAIKNHRLIAHGSIINNGTIGFSSNANETGVELVFTGPGNAIFNCSDAILTNLRQENGITLNKGKSAASVLSFIPGKVFQVLSASGSNAKGFLTIDNGTFNVIGSRDFRNPIFNTDGTYTIPATGGFWLGNLNAEITGLNGDIIIQGELKITNGIFNAGTSAENSLKTEGNGNLKISGGIANVAGNLSVDGGICSISGGRLNLAVLPNSANNEPAFGVSSKAKLEMFGNPLVTITYPNSGQQLANDIQIQEGSGSKFISGGAIRLGTEVTPAQSFFLVSGERIIPYLTAFSECSTVAYNTSKADVATIQVSALPRIALDKTVPEITAPSKITIRCGETLPPGYASLAEFTNAGGVVSDNCALNPSAFKLVKEVRSKTICPYIVTRTYEIADASGNMATAEQQIQVEGNIAEPKAEPVSGQPIAQELKLKSAMGGATITSTTTGGNWSDTSSWTGGVVPSAGDNVVIVSGATVTINAAVACDNITIDSGGTLTHSGTNTLTVNGDWINNGTYVGGTNGIVEFAGTSNATISGATNFEELKINKGSLNTTLTINGTITVTNGGSLTMGSGLITIPAGGSFAVNPSSGLTIQKTAGFDLIGGTLNTGNFTITNEGLIRVSSGTANFGSGSGNAVHTQVDGAFVVSGGTVTLSGRLENSASGTLNPPGVSSGISISGGTITLATVGNGLSSVGTLNVTSAGTFNFIGGTIVFQNESTATTAIDLGLYSGTGPKTTVGGTFQFGNGSTPAGTVFNISSEILLDRVTSIANADIKLIDDITIRQLALAGGSSVNLNGNEILLAVNSLTTYDFPIDNGSGVSIPVSVQLIGGTLASGAYIKLETFGLKQPNNESDVNFLNRYWTITTSGITSPVYNVTATYADPADIAGTESKIAMGSYSGSLPWIKYGNANASANTLSANGITAPSFTFTGITSDPPTVSVAATPTTICNGASSNLTATPVGDNPFTYSWAPTTGLSDPTIANPVATPPSTTTYTVTVTDGNGFTASGTATITVNPLNTVSAASSTPTLCISTPLTAITHTTTGATGIASDGVSGANGLPTGVSAHWAANTITISGTPIVTGTFNYSIPLTGGCGNVAAIGTIIVNPTPTVSITASPGNTICSGDNVTFSTNVANAGSAPSYQWYINGVLVSGATGSTFSSTTLANTQKVSVVVTADPTYCSATANSNIITMTVNPSVIPTVSILESANNICAGSSVTFASTVVNGGSAPTYQWQLNGAPVSGATGSSYTSNTLINGDQVRVVVNSNANCAINNPATSNTITITVNPIVTPSVSIVADQTTICPGATVSFTATPVNGGSNPAYQWKINGVNAGSNNPTFTTSSLLQGDKITVVMTSSIPCASPTLAASNEIIITVNPGTPAIPGAISGLNPACPDLTNQIYSVAAVPGTTSYNWTVPIGWSITSGVGTNSITVTTGAAGQNGNITVNASNSCGTSAVRTLAVTVNPGTPATPGAIAGTVAVCPAISGLTYSITAVLNATSYTWTLPSGWTGTSTTNSINVTSGSAGQNGNIEVTATNSCGTSTASTLAVTVSPGTPAQPAAITGNSSVCPAATGLVYSVSAVPNATSYNWTVPTGWTITGGAGTSSITVTAGSAGQNGNITVTAINICGTSAAQTLAVATSSGIPAVPGPITGNSDQCANTSGHIYSIASVPNATTYSWSLPSGWTISVGAGTTSITVSIAAGAASGNISVTAGNICGTSSTSVLAVYVVSSVPATPGSLTGLSAVCPVKNISYSISSVTNALNYTWTVPTNWSILSGQGTTSITVQVPTNASSGDVSVTANNVCGNSSPRTLTVSVATTAWVNAGFDQIVCQGTAAVTLAGTVGGAIRENQQNEWDWVVVSGTIVSPNSLTSSYTLPNSGNTPGVYTVKLTSNVNAVGCNKTEDEMTITILQTPNATISGNNTICSGSSSSVTFTATPNTTVSYKINGGSVITLDIGATGTASINTGGLVTNTTYSLTTVAYTTAPTCSHSVSGTATITVNPAATANAGADQTICANGAVTLAGIVGGAATSATWSGGAGTFNPNNTTLNAIYTPSAAEILAGSVNLILTTNDPDGGAPCSAATDFMILTINPVATVNAGPAQTICAGSTATMAGVIGGSATSANWSGGGGIFSPNNTTLNAVYTPSSAEVLAGITTLTLTSDDPIGPCGQVSSTVTIFINPVATVNAGADQVVCASAPVLLAGSVGGGASSGTWTGGLGTFSPNNTTLNATYSPTAAEIADGVVTLTLTTNDPSGPCGVVSDQVKITINPSATVNAGLDQEICQGSFIILAGTKGGAATSVIWSGGTGTFSPNNTVLNATYTPGAAETGSVTLTLTTNVPSGSCPSASDQVVITIDPKPLVTVSPSQIICSNATAIVTGTFSGGATTATWSTSGSGTFSSINSPTAVYTPGNSDIFNGTVTLTYTTDDPPGLCGPASASLILTVKKVILITSQPVNTGVCATKPADLIVTAVGDNLTYQWYRGVAPGGTPVVNSANISGAQSATLHFNNATSGDSGSYYVVISSANACSSETSTTVTLNVDEEITVTTQIHSNSVCIGDPVTFNIVAEPGGVLTYQWRKNGVDITGQTSNTLNLGNVTLADAGGYDVQIKGMSGYTCSDAQSALATLVVNGAATLSLTSAAGTNSQNGCVDQPITNITYAVGGGATNASITGLPAGVTGTYNTGVFTISGTPTVTGTFSYTINTTGNCTQTSTTGTISISPSPTISLGTISLYCPAATSFALPYTAITGSPVTYSISAGTPALPGFVPVVDAALGASPINVLLPSGVTSGTYQFTISVKNGTGCPSVNQTFNVTFRDVTPPVAPTFPAITAQCSVTLTPPGTTDNALISIPTATDDCSGTVTGTTTTTFPYTLTGTHNIVWTFTDASGNTTTATQVVTINDQTAPTWVTFPADKTLECGGTLDTTPAATGTPTATDNCSVVTISMTETTIPGTCPSRYSIKRTWKATDASGKFVTRDQLINVEDTTPPVINCTSYTNFDANKVPSSDLHVGVTATDNCSPAGAIMFELISEEYSGLDNAAGFCPSGLERVYRAIDACGNFSGTCTQTYTFTPNPNCQACIDDPNTPDDNVPFFPVIFNQPDQSWTSPNVIRNGVCCWAEGPPPPRCISFNVYLHPDAVGLIFTIPTGAIPGGALYYHVDCGPPQKVGEVLCLSGGRFYTITFCEPGNNPNTYKIESIKGAAVTDDIITRADANCVKNVTVTGLEENSYLKWTVKYPAGADSLLNRLSCTNCLTPVFTPNAYTPPTIIYQICGQVKGSYLCNSLPVTDCAELTVTTLPAIEVSFNIDLDNICEDEIPGIDATITPGGFAYLFEWYDGPDGTGTLLSTSSTWTPTTQGDYSLVVTENQSGVSCNRSVHNFNITFDYIGPSSLTVPPPLQIDCNLPTADFDLAVATWLASATASDTNISSIPVTNNYTSFVHSCGAIKTVTFSASDNCGNTTTATSEIRIIDTTPPVITTPATNQTVECDGAGNTTALNSWLSSSAGSVATDACGGTISWTNNYSALSGLCGATGVATVTFTATDACGNASTSVATFKIVDTTRPVISCPTPVSGIADTAECFATGINLGTATATDNCSTVSVTNNAPAQFPVGVTTVTWTATDACGNVASCTQLVTILDNNQPPTITCPTGPYVETIAPDQCSKTGVNPGSPTIWDNCPNPVMTYVLTGVTTGSGVGVVSNTTFNVGVTTITYTVTDAGGGTASCSFSVWIKRLDIPASTVTCTTSPTPVNAVAGTCSAPVTLTSPLINDPCNSIVSVVHNSAYGTSSSDASGTYPVGTTTVTWTITDTSGNIKTCTQTVNVVDTQTPTISCPADVEDQITNGGCNLLSGNVQTPTISDNCGIASLTYVLSGATNLVSPSTGLNYANGITYNVGVTTVTYTVTDVNGLTASCTHTVWIKNLNAPKFNVTCRTGTEQSIVVPADPGECEADVTVLSPIITNPCNEIYAITNDITGTATATGTYLVGTTTITWTIKDASGNLFTCTQTVNVVDTQTPTISCPSDVEDQITNGGCNLLSGNVQTPTISDNCGIASLTYALSGATNLVSPSTGINYANGITYSVGITTVTYTVTDVNGLTASCTHTVWIKNLNAPKFSSTQPSNVNVPADPGECQADVTVPSPGINNPCNELYSSVNDSPYKTSITDASGTYPIGTTTVTWVVTDASGSKATYTQTVTVVDTQVPSFTSCPTDISEPADFEKLFATNVDIPVQPTFVADNCTTTLSWTIVHETTGTVSSSVTTGINYVPTPYPQLDLGVNTVIYLLSDDSGNTSTCTFTVTITAKPVIDCPADIVTNTTASDCTQSLDPGVPELISGSQPITWTWTIVDPTGNIQASGTFSGTVPIPGGPPDLGDIVFKEGTSTITWTATNLAGTTSCTHTVTVIDNVKPTFDLPTAFSECVERIHDATFYAPTVDITPTRPEYYILEPGNISLDLTGLWDNCCTTASLTVHWRIEFTDTTDPAAPPAILHINPITGTGQLSTYGTPILFPGDGVTFNNVIHKIYYWLEDCHGNKTDEQPFDVTIRPRPEVIKMN